MPCPIDYPSFWQPTSPAGCYFRTTEYAVALVAALLIPLLRLVVDAVLIAPLGRHLLRLDKSSKPTELGTLFKLRESAWKFIVYVSLCALELYVVWDEPYRTDTTAYWTGCSELPCAGLVKPGMKLLYAVQLGYYLQAVPELMLVGVRRKDYWQLMAHHFVTILLVVYSLELGFTRVGSMVFLVHDVNDPFMELAKMFRYVTGRDDSLGTTLCFGAFVLSWFGSRIYYFPCQIVRSTLVEGAVVSASWAESDAGPRHYFLFNALLLSLLVLHVYWSCLILRILYNVLTSGGADDVREKDD